MSDPYETLQVARNAEIEVIEAAYRSLARKYHPDRTASAASTKRMQEINAAYAVLKDPAKRIEYDRKHPSGPRSYIVTGSEFIDWSEADHWATACARRRRHTVPIRRQSFLVRNWGCLVYLLIVVFALFASISALAVR
jgi:curved DNA-binding protein CbpA